MKKIYKFLLPFLILVGCNKSEPVQPVYSELDLLKATLKEFYEATGGPYWDVQPNWESATSIDAMDFIHYGGSRWDYGLDINLSDMNLCGEIPASFFDLPLIQVKLEDNQLYGQLPENVGANGLLELLNISDNHLEGSLPASLGKSRELMLVAENNRLTGTVPDEILTGCYIVSEWVLSQQEGYGLDIAEKVLPLEGEKQILLDLYEELPEVDQMRLNWKNEADAELWEHVTWNLKGQCVEVMLPYFNITEFPENLLKLKELRYLDLENNDLTVLPDLSALTHLQWLELSENRLLSLGEDCEFPSDLTVLDLAHNHIAGEIPASLNKLKSLVVLDLRGNQFFGKVPPLDQLTQLKFLMLDEMYKLDPQPLPESISKLTQLRFFSSKGTNFIGKIPSSWKNLVSLVGIDLMGNKLDGEVNDLFLNMQNLEYVNLGENNLSGPLPIFSTVNSLKSLDLCRNNFSGEIPDNWDALRLLNELHIDSNLIEGNIPEFFWKLNRLEYFDCRLNKMSGELSEKLLSNPHFEDWRWDEQDFGSLVLPEQEAHLTSFRQSAAHEDFKAVQLKSIKDELKAQLRQSY